MQPTRGARRLARKGEIIAATDRTGLAGVRPVNKDEWYKLVDEQAQRLLGMSAEVFIPKYKAGGFGDPDDDPRVMWLVMLLPDDLTTP